MKCDVFISYRRDGGDMTAMYLYQALKERGYDVFYDLEVLRAGKFNEALLEYIQSCQDFLLVLSPHALDRCSDEKDWVRKEIAEALRCKKNIIPVIMNGFNFPEKLPEDIDDVRYQNGLSATTEYFQESMNRLCSRYLNAKPRKKQGKLIALAAAAAVALGGFAGWFFLAGPGKTPAAQPVGNIPPEAVAVIPAAPTQGILPDPTEAPTPIPLTDKPLMITDNLPEAFNEIGIYTTAPVLGNENLTREQIFSVTFLDSRSTAESDAWDVSLAGDGSVLAWVKPFDTGYDLYIAGEGGVALSPSQDGDYSMFAGYVNATEIRFGGCVDTTLLTSMLGMFDSCVQLKKVDLTGCDTSNVVNLSALFNGCENLQEVTLPDGFVTGATREMYWMFRDCRSLQRVNTTGWDTSNVVDMNEIFFGCDALEKPDMSQWDLTNIANRPVLRFDPLPDGVPYEEAKVLDHETLMRSQVASVTFLPAKVGQSADCWDVSVGQPDSVHAWTEAREDGLFDLYIAGDGGVTFLDARVVAYDGDDYPFFTGYVNMERIQFNNCVDFSAIRSAHALFEGCERLVEIDLTGMDFSQVRRFSAMFLNCHSLRRAVLPGLVTDRVTKTDWMFGNCENLAEIDMTGWDTSGIESAQDVFNSCASLRELDLSGWDTSRLKYINGIFEHCTGLERVNVSNWNTSRIHNMNAAFAFCGNLKELDLSGWDTSGTREMYSLFLHCAQMSNLILPDGFVGANIQSTKEMFSGCVTLSQINTTGWDTSGITDMSGMFQGCQNLTTLDQSGWVYHPEVDTTDMFLECDKLQGV